MMIIIQILINSLISGLLLALIAIGFYLIFNTTKVFHIAHGAFYTLGGFIFLWFLEFMQISFLFSLIVSLIFIIVLSALVELLIYKKLSKNNASQAITLIASMGIYLLFVNFVALVFGNGSKIIQNYSSSSYDFFQLILTQIQIIQFIVSIIILSIILLLGNSSFYLKMKAVMSNRDVASVLGINYNSIRLISICFGSVLAAIACILELYDTGINPYSGLSLSLSAAVVVILGGGYSLGGTIIASLFISFIQSFTEFFVSAQWMEGVTFLILIVVILWKTEGIVSFKMRLEEK